MKESLEFSTSFNLELAQCSPSDAWWVYSFAASKNQTVNLTKKIHKQYIYQNFFDRSCNLFSPELPRPVT